LRTASASRGFRDTEYRLRNRAETVGVSRKLGSRMEVGGFYAHDRGSVRGHTLRQRVSGDTFGATARLIPAAQRRFSASAGASTGSFEFKGHRVAPSRVYQVATDARSYDAWLDLDYRVWSKGKIALSAVSNTSYTVAYVKGFSEVGGVDAFRVHGQNDESVLNESGLEATLNLASRLSVAFELTYAQNFRSIRREVYATLISDSERVRLTANGVDVDGLQGAANIRYRFTDRISAGAYCEGGLEKAAQGRSFGLQLSGTF
jgi:hypothetical protein